MPPPSAAEIINFGCPRRGHKGQTFGEILLLIITPGTASSRTLSWMLWVEEQFAHDSSHQIHHLVRFLKHHRGYYVDTAVFYNCHSTKKNTKRRDEDDSDCDDTKKADKDELREISEKLTALLLRA